MLYGTLRITTPDGQVREHPIDTEDAVLGRATGNQVVIDHVSVSRRHALLVIEGNELYVEDLSSATGTYIGGVQLEPHARRLLPAGGAVRWGDVEGVWQSAVTPAAAWSATPSAGAGAVGPLPDPAAAVGPDPALPSDGLAPTAPGGGFSNPEATTPPPVIGAVAFGGPRANPLSSPQRASDPSQFIATSIASPPAPVAAGAATSAILSVHNRGSVVDEISITVVDLPAGWARVTRPQLSMLPGARDEINIALQPPKGPEATAGEHSFSVAVNSREHRVEVRSVGKFSILPFEGMTLELKTVRSSKNFKVEVANQGNTPINLTLAGIDDESALDYTFSPEALTVEPGQTAQVGLQVKPKKRKLFGKAEVKAFSVEGRSKTNQLRAAAQGQLKSKPPLQAWKLPVLLLLALGLLGLGGWQYRARCEGGWPVCGATKAAPASPTPQPATATASPTAPSTAAPTATRTAAPATTTAVPTTGVLKLHAGGHAEVINSAPVPLTNCLAVRTSPSKLAGDPNIVLRGGQPLRLCNGAKVTIVDGPTNDGAFYWWIIKDDGWTAADGVTWAAEGKTDGSEIYLKPID